MRWGAAVAAVGLLAVGCSTSDGEGSSTVPSAPARLEADLEQLNEAYERFVDLGGLLIETEERLVAEVISCDDDADCGLGWRIEGADYLSVAELPGSASLGRVVARSDGVPIRLIEDAAPAAYLAAEYDGQLLLLRGPIPRYATNRADAEALRAARCSLADDVAEFVHLSDCDSPVVRWVDRVEEPRPTFDDPAALSSTYVIRQEPTDEFVEHVIAGRIEGRSFGQLRSGERAGPYGSAIAAMAAVDQNCWGECRRRVTAVTEASVRVETLRQPGITTGTAPHGETHHGVTTLELLGESGWWLTEVGPLAVHTNASPADASARLDEFESQESMALPHAPPPTPTTLLDPATLPQGRPVWRRSPESDGFGFPEALTAGNLTVLPDLCVVLTSMYKVLPPIVVLMPPHSVVADDGRIHTRDLTIEPGQIVEVGGGEISSPEIASTYLDDESPKSCAPKGRFWLASIIQPRLEPSR